MIISTFKCQHEHNFSFYEYEGDIELLFDYLFLSLNIFSFSCCRRQCHVITCVAESEIIEGYETQGMR